MNTRVRSSDAGAISVAVSKILTEYSEDVAETAARVSKEVAKEVAQDLKATSPKAARNGGAYASGWAVKTEKSSMMRGGSSVVYNAKMPGLTHLLEKGHVVLNQHGAPRRAGAKRRVDGIPHIAPAAEKGAEEFERRMREAIE